MDLWKILKTMSNAVVFRFHVNLPGHNVDGRSTDVGSRETFVRRFSLSA